jgi:hypothetical protein
MLDHMLLKLSAAGHDILIFDNLSTGHPCLSRGFPFIQEQGPLRLAGKAAVRRDCKLRMELGALAPAIELAAVKAQFLQERCLN